jgi:hypothetical protein
MPARATDIPILLRRFDGTNRQVDSVYLGPSYLRRSTNWVPQPSFVLTKRWGTAAYRAPPEGLRIDAMLRAYTADDTVRYLYAVVTGGTGDALQVSIDDGPFVTVANGGFATPGARYDLVQIGDVIYAGNGVDPIKRVPLGGAATNLAGLGSFTDGSAAPTLTNDANAPLLPGTYSYGWAVFNHDTRAWVMRSQAREVTKIDAGDQHLEFPPPTGYTLGPNERFHLFVAPVNLPIELAMDQMPEGGAGASGPHPTVTLRSMQASPSFWPLRGVARSGRMLLAHGARLWFAGFPADPTAVMATNILFPNREQPIYNQAEFFPVNALIRLPAPATGLGVASVSEYEAPESPVALFTRTRTFLFFGDILADDASRLVEVSSRIGCVSHATVVATPYGLFWLGPESVYQMQPGGGAPIDVGWPMAPEVRQIPASRRNYATATFHKGFYKLAFSTPGATVNDMIWWLDLRLGGVGATPRWWGPHTGPYPSAYAVGLIDPAELDRGFVASEDPGAAAQWDVDYWDTAQWGSGGVVLLDDQVGRVADQDRVIAATLESGELDGGAPFDKKVFSRVRVTAQAELDTTLSVTLETSPGLSTFFDPIAIVGSAMGALWDVGLWDIAQWGGSLQRFDEAQTTAPADRPTGLWGNLILQHTAPINMALRDVELRAHPVERPVRTPDAPPRA